MADPQESRDGDFAPGYSSSVQQKSSNPESSCVSMKSNRSMDPPLQFKSGDKRLNLRLRGCGVTDEGCNALASALRSTPSHLRYLDLSVNKLGDLGVKLLSARLKNPHCKLERLWLVGCGVRDEGCVALASALRSNPSHLRYLDLSDNKLGDSGVKLLSAGLEDPHCKLEELRLMDCGVTDEGCVALASALRSNPSHLRALILYNNKLEYSGVELLEDLKDDPHYKLETLLTDYLMPIRIHYRDSQSTESTETEETVTSLL